MVIWLRSAIFFTGLIVLLVLFLPLTLVFAFLPLMHRHQFVCQKWTRIVIIWLRFTCGLDYSVIFKAPLPDSPAVIMCKHQSAWETLALQLILPLHVWVLKRELLWIPIFGWELAAMGPIAINRKNRATAQKQLMEQGQDRVDQGFWIMIFPEGTRIAPGKRGQYKYGGARLASMLNLPLVPVAHNAGEFWPRNGFRKYPGKITVIVGEAIYPSGKDHKELTHEIEAWIENEMLKITGQGPKGPQHLHTIR